MEYFLKKTCNPNTYFPSCHLPCKLSTALNWDSEHTPYACSEYNRYAEPVKILNYVKNEIKMPQDTKVKPPSIYWPVHLWWCLQEASQQNGSVKLNVTAIWDCHFFQTLFPPFTSNILLLPSSTVWLSLPINDKNMINKLSQYIKNKNINILKIKIYLGITLRPT